MLKGNRPEDYTIENAKNEAENIKGYVSSYYSSEDNELIVELENSICYIYSFNSHTWSKSQFYEESDFDISQYIKVLKGRELIISERQKRKNIITVMADYCAYALWLNGRNVEYDCKDIPYSLRLLKKKLDSWSWQYELFFKIEESKIDKKRLESSYKYKKWLKEGFELAKLVRKMTPSRFEVEYFNEKTLKRERIY